MSFDPLPPPFTASDPTALYTAATTLELLLLELVPFTRTLITPSSPVFPSPGSTLDDDALFTRLESLGHRVGMGLAERFSRDKTRMTDTLDVIKFICKDLWTVAFRKQIDNLKTNHRGVYVLTDSGFRGLMRMSTERGGDAVREAQPFLWFPCGIVRGALENMGVEATVQAETSELPVAVFKIEVTGKSGA